MALEPIKIRTQKINDTTIRITVSWSLVTDATYYDVSIYTKPKSIKTEVFRILNPSTSYYVDFDSTDITEGMIIYAAVRTHNEMKRASITYTEVVEPPPPPPPPPTGSTEYPNEPSDYVLLSELVGNSIPPTSPSVVPAGWTNKWGSTGVSNFSLVDDPTNPFAEPKVLALKYPKDLPPGSGPCNLWTGWATGGGVPEDIGECSEVYFAYKFKIFGNNGSDYENQIAGTKLGFFSGPNVTGAQNDFIPFLSGNGTTGLFTSFGFEVRQQNIAARNLVRNIGSGPVLFVNTWHTVEWQCITNNPSSVNNGILRVWVDGVKIIEYTDVKWRSDAYPRKFLDYKLAPTWGGVGGPNKSRDDFIYFSRIRISGKL